MGAAFANLLLTLLIIQAADSSQTIIDQAIKARGGSDQLSQIKAFQAKTKGHIYVADSAYPFTATIQSQLPDQYKHVMDYLRNGQALKQIQIYAGDKAWIHVNDEPQELDEQLLEALLRGRYAERLSNPALLKDRTYQLSSLGDSKVEGHDVAGVLATTAKKPPVKLFFDKSTGLLLKTEHRQMDPRSREEITQESFYSDCRIPDTTMADEQALKAARIETNGPSLLEYIRRRIATPIDGEKVRALIRQLGDDSFEVREKATQALIALGEPAVPFLQPAAKSTDLEVARRAERCLQAIIKDPVRRETEAATTIAAVRLLTKKKPPGTTEALLTLFSQPSSVEIEREIRFALRILGKSDGQPDPVLVKAMEDKDPRRRQVAAEALGRAPLPPGSRLLLPNVAYPMKGAVFRGGKKFMDWEVLDVIFLNHIDDKEFTLP